MSGEKIIFITGGARSGKSRFALQFANTISPMRKAYIATAEALDKEMRERIENHKRLRGDEWDTYEEPIKIADVIKKIEGKYSAIVIDCLTLWLSNLMHAGLNIDEEIENLIGTLKNCRGVLQYAPTQKPKLFIVSNEVGMGIVPDNELARHFRDIAGFLNQKIAEIANEVYMVVAGIPVKVK